MRRIVKAGLEPILKFNATPLFDATRYNAPAAILLGVTKSKLELEEDNQKLVRSLKEKVGYKEQSGIMQSMKELHDEPTHLMKSTFDEVTSLIANRIVSSPLTGGRSQQATRCSNATPPTHSKSSASSSVPPSSPLWATRCTAAGTPTSPTTIPP